MLGRLFSRSADIEMQPLLPIHRGHIVASAVPATPRCSLAPLPDDVLCTIASSLESADLAHLAQSCTAMQRVATLPACYQPVIRGMQLTQLSRLNTFPEPSTGKEDSQFAQKIVSAIDFFSQALSIVSEATPSTPGKVFKASVNIFAGILAGGVIGELTGVVVYATCPSVLEKIDPLLAGMAVGAGATPILIVAAAAVRSMAAGVVALNRRTAARAALEHQTKEDLAIKQLVALRDAQVAMPAAPARRALFFAAHLEKRASKAFEQAIEAKDTAAMVSCLQDFQSPHLTRMAQANAELLVSTAADQLREGWHIDTAEILLASLGMKSEATLSVEWAQITSLGAKDISPTEHPHLHAQLQKALMTALENHQWPLTGKLAASMADFFTTPVSAFSLTIKQRLESILRAQLGSGLYFQITPLTECMKTAGLAPQHILNAALTDATLKGDVRGSVNLIECGAKFDTREAKTRQALSHYGAQVARASKPLDLPALAVLTLPSILNAIMEAIKTVQSPKNV
jgi:hypothetical protein